MPKTMLKYLYPLITLAPAPIFFIFGVYSLLHTPALCGSFSHEMTVMWFVMSLAHLAPWIIRLQQLHFTRNA